MGETGQERCETRLPQKCKANAKVQRRSVQEPQMMKRNSQGCNASAKGLTQAMLEQERFEIRLHQLGRANMWAQWKRKQKRRMRMKGQERERGGEEEEGGREERRERRGGGHRGGREKGERWCQREGRKTREGEGEGSQDKERGKARKGRKRGDGWQGAWGWTERGEWGGPSGKVPGPRGQ